MDPDSMDAERARVDLKGSDRLKTLRLRSRLESFALLGYTVLIYVLIYRLSSGSQTLQIAMGTLMETKDMPQHSVADAIASYHAGIGNLFWVVACLQLIVQALISIRGRSAAPMHPADSPALLTLAFLVMLILPGYIFARLTQDLVPDAAPLTVDRQCLVAFAAITLGMFWYVRVVFLRVSAVDDPLSS